MTMVFFAHDESCCGRDLIIGARYRRQSMDVMTGRMTEWLTFRVIDLDPIRHDRLLCRRVHLHCEELGRVYHPQVVNFWADRYQAVDNVVRLRSPRLRRES